MRGRAIQRDREKKNVVRTMTSREPVQSDLALIDGSPLQMREHALGAWYVEQDADTDTPDEAPSSSLLLPRPSRLPAP